MAFLDAVLPGTIGSVIGCDYPRRTRTLNRSRPARLAVLISGSGRSLENLLNVIANGILDADVVAVVSSKPGVRGLEIATAAGVPVAIVTRSGFNSRDAFSDAIYAELEPFDPDLIILAGFLKQLTVPGRWSGRILNIHPGLIGESEAAGKGFYGARVHQAVLESGAAESGATVHVVDDEYDHGPVVMQARVPVLAGDTAETLAARVFAAECDLYPRAIAAYIAADPDLLDRAVT